LKLARLNWKDPVLRNQKLNDWIHFARSKYLLGVTPPIIRKEWYSLLAFGFISFGLVTYSWKKRS
jgi:hypothetical protein